MKTTQFALLIFYFFIFLPESFAYQNRISLEPGYSFNFFDDSAAKRQDGMIGPIYLGKMEYDLSNSSNLYFEFSLMQPNLLGSGSTLDEKTFHCTSGMGVKYYPRTRGRSDFRQQGDTYVFITSNYTFNPFVTIGLGAYSLIENARSKLKSGMTITGSRLLLGGNLSTGTDIVLNSKFGLTFETRYFTVKSLYSKTVDNYPANLLIIGVTLHAGVYFNF